MPENPYDYTRFRDDYCTYEVGYYNDNQEWIPGFPQGGFSGDAYSCRLLSVANDCYTLILPNHRFLAYDYAGMQQYLRLIDIAPSAASGRNNLRSVTIAADARNIGNGAFSYCTSLKSIVITGVVSGIGANAFYGCSMLTRIQIPYSVTSIGDSAFSGCSRLAQVIFEEHSNLTSVGKGAFAGCESLESITIPTGVTSIGEYTFRGCAALTAINIHDSVTSIGYGVAQGCTALERLTVPFVGHKQLTSTSNSYLYRIGYIFGTDSSNATGVQEVLPKNLDTIVVSRSTAFLADQAFAFANMVNKIQIKLDDGATDFCFGRAAFYGCSNLETLSIAKVFDEDEPTTINRLDCRAGSVFANCGKLKNITLPHTKAFVTSAYKALQISTDPMPASVEASLIPATLIGRGMTPDYNIFLQLILPTAITITNFSADGLYGNVTINSQTTLKLLASMSSVKTKYEELAGSVSYANLAAFTEAILNINLINYVPVSTLQMRYQLDLTFIDGTSARVAMDAHTCSAMKVLEKDESGNYAESTKISYSSSTFLEQTASGWRPMSLTAVQSYVSTRSTGIQAYSIQAIGTSFFAGTSNLQGVGSVSITAPQKLIHRFMADTNDNNSRLKSVTFSCVSVEHEIGGFDSCAWLTDAVYTSIYEKDIQSLADYAFNKCQRLTVFKCDCVSSIGYAAFAYCTGLTTVELPAAVEMRTRSRFSDLPTAWGDYQSAVGSSLAFYSCANLAKLTLKFAEITSIGDYAFAGCAALSWDGGARKGEEAEEKPNWASLKSIGYHAFLNCGRLTTIGKLAAVADIYFSAFQGCAALTAITVPKVYTEVDSFQGKQNYDNFGAFFGARSYEKNAEKVPNTLTTVEITGIVSAATPDDSHVTCIGDYAFSGCSSLTSIKIPDGVTSIGGWAFERCSGLTAIEIPDGVTSIGESVFAGCWGLTSITLPFMRNRLGQLFGTYNYGSSQESSRSVTQHTSLTETETYYMPTNLAGIYITSESPAVGVGAFDKCTSLSYISFRWGLPSTIPAYAFNECTAAGFYPTPIGSGGNVGVLSLSACTSIADYAFCNCTIHSFGDLDLSLLTELGEHAFYGCCGITSVTLAKTSLQSIKPSTFSGCEALEEITVPSSLTSIDKEAFKNCTSLGSIEIPKFVNTLGEKAFYGCTALTQIAFAGERVLGDNITYLTVGANAFSDIGKDAETELPLTIKVGDLQDYAYCDFRSAGDSLCARGTTRIINSEDVTLYTHLHILPTDDYTIGAFAFYNWKPAYEVAVFAPEGDNTTRNFGDSALAINGTLYWYDDRNGTAVTGNADTSIKHNFGLNNWLSDLPPDDNTAVAQWQTQDSGSIKAFQANYNYTSSFKLQGLTGKLLKSNSTEPLQFQSDNPSVNIVLASTHQVDFVGTITLPEGLHSVRIYTGDTKACKRRIITISPPPPQKDTQPAARQAEAPSIPQLTLPVGSWVAVKPDNAPVQYLGGGVNSVTLEINNTKYTIILAS